MRILVTNDDGIFSPGLVALARAAIHFGQVRVVAPDGEQSAMGHAITIQRPLQYHRVHLDSLDAYRVNGTPADCVALGLYRWEGADLVLSGINLGSNLGHDVWHSGTVGAAKQAVLLGIQAAAFSLALDEEEPEFEPLLPYVEQVIHTLLEDQRPKLVNVNLPQNPRGIRWVRQSVRAYSGQVLEGEDPMGWRHYWFAASPQTDPEEDTDRWAVERGLIAMTPLRLDLTDEEWLQRMRLIAEEEM
ncbi:MAG TPA: 5'/3'-nucleotidase SurE [Anaerolineales bacterium]|nr:5'/3'-nucleotidase SurE [Anaerolineales bacterium]